MENKDVINLGVKLDPELKKRFKIACATIGKTMSDVTESLIEGWLIDNDSGTS